MGIPLFASVPFPNFDSQWSPFDRDVLARMLEQARETKVVCDEYSDAAYQARNIYMVDHCDLLLAYNVPGKPGKTGGTANCMEYARSVIKPMRNIDITKLFPTLDKNLFTK
jgi:uncharacterized phage-like protein YoqJ